MIIMINGAFGVGKTSVASELVKVLPNSMIFDPEEVGYMLRNIITDEIKREHERSDDFQDLELWPTLTVTIAQEMIKKYQRNLIVPMTIYRKSYLDSIRSAFYHMDKETYHFCLTAERGTIHKRLVERGEIIGNWAFRQTDKCIDAYQDDFFGQFICTEQLTVTEIVAFVLDAVSVNQ